MKTGVICDGISRDLDHALTVMSEFDLEYAELQFVWDKEVGDHSPDEIAKIKELLSSHNKPVSCLSRHIFAGMTTANRPGDALHEKHMDALKRVIAMAHGPRDSWDTPLLRACREVIQCTWSCQRAAGAAEPPRGRMQALHVYNAGCGIGPRTSPRARCSPAASP